MKFFSHIRSVIRFLALAEKDRKIVFYSEGKDYWPHLAGIVEALLEVGNVSVCYITSDKADPGLTKIAKNYNSFIIDEGPVRNWLFQNMPSCVCVMTTPDLDNFQVKKSANPVHYVYSQHSLVSLHSAYRCGAFDHYDTIFCAGPHHVREMRALQKQRNLPEKKLVEHGYTRLDKVRADNADQTSSGLIDDKQHILIAPTWGPSGLIERGLAPIIIKSLIEDDCQIVLRPHPQTIKLSETQIAQIEQIFKKEPNFQIEKTTQNTNSLRDASLMITDWSGAAYDFAFGYKKPVLFVDTPPKINNPEFEDLHLDTFEQSMRSNLGMVVQDPTEIKDCVKKIENTNRTVCENDFVFHLDRSSVIAANYLISICR